MVKKAIKLPELHLQFLNWNDTTKAKQQSQQLPTKLKLQSQNSHHYP